MESTLPARNTVEFDHFLKVHRHQLETSCVPEHLWEALHRKLRDETFDAGESFMFARIRSDDEDTDDDEGDLEVVVSREDGIDKTDPSQIYLCVHAWTFRPNDARRVLLSNAGLRSRLAALMDMDSTSINDVLPRLWRLTQTYSLNTSQAEDAVPIWYVTDDLGSRIGHSREPNFRLVPFFYGPHQVAYSLLFPIENVEVNDVVTRNYVEGPWNDEATVRALLLPWYDFDFRETDFRQYEPEEQFFQSGRQNETLPEANGFAYEGDHTPQTLPRRPKVFTEYLVLQENLRADGRYEVTEHFEGADIVWLNTHFKDFANLKKEYPNVLINQFPFEHVLTVKDLFAVVGRRGAPPPRGLETFPDWLPTSFNLMTELPKFAGYFQRREAAGLDNHWIVKPFNLARSLDTHLTDSLEFIARLATTGPKIACKYISDPVLFNREGIGRVKFDVRYCVLLRDTCPLRLLVHRKFYLRFANRPFALDELDVYEKHFTVMNYADDVEMQNMLCDDFVVKFQQQTGVTWEAVEGKIFAAFRSLFRNAISLPPPQGLGYNPQSRAMYAVDLMLERRDGGIQPKLLELNWAPDCKRACQFYPTFFGDIFDALFKDDLTSGNVISIV
ncbi:tubulin--tyrosine ligase protein 12-like [Tropilaelaps mercedesae]|uniref:Tubulin--tyrosine ligase protein 12-like n=1 Tax=Tropilaelaps mercedesae TaxID=418985 RepID=A0A1V9XPF2_9ACAR|nr:tubulin--tyrosine ligase protein 12-like [Tropilaelaps mercedesae]